MKDSQYNISEVPSLYAGSYFKQSFLVYDADTKEPVDLTDVASITFKLCPYGDNENTLITFSDTDVYQGVHRIVVDNTNTAKMTIYLYAFDTTDLPDNYYDYQISVGGIYEEETAIIAQGRLRIYNKIG